MSDNIKTWFDRIYLVHGGDTAEVPPYSEASGDEITWCKDNVEGNGIEYVRADLVTAPPMSTTPPTPKPTPKPWREAAVDEILTVMREMENHVDRWINRDDHHSDSVEVAKHHLSREFAAILAKHDPANARPLEFRRGQVWLKNGCRYTIRMVDLVDVWWVENLPDSQGKTGLYKTTIRFMRAWARTARLVADPNATTPAPTSGLDHTQGTI